MSGYYDSDVSAIGRIRSNQAAAVYRQQFAAQDGFTDLLARYSEAYPDADPQILFSFAMSGQDPTSPAVQEALAYSFDVDRKKGVFDRLGDIVSPVTEAISDAGGAVARGLDTALGGFDEELLPSVKGGVRTGFVVLESGLQELQTFSRAGLATVIGARPDGRGGGQDLATNWSKAGTSSLREVIGNWRDGEDIDLGTGFLPGGAIEQRVKDRAGQLQVRVNGVDFGGPGNQALTLGRAIAANVGEPGTAEFNILSGLVDAGVAWYADPASVVGSVAKTAEALPRLGRAAGVLRSGEGLGAAAVELATKPTLASVVDRSGQGRLLNDVAGRIFGTRKTVDVSAEWVRKGGRRVLDRMAETTDVYDLWQATSGKIPVGTLVKIADAPTSQDVLNILDPLLGTTLREAPQFLGFKVKRNYRQGVRILSDMPGIHLDPNDLDDAVTQVDNLMRTAKASPELRRTAFDKVARNTSRQTMVATLSDVMGDLADELGGTVKGGKNRARSLTRLYSRDLDEVRTYLVDEIAENRKAIGVKIGDSAVELQSPFLYTEYLNSLVPLPDARELRRATSSLSKFVDTPFFDRAVTALDRGQGAWKRLTLLRGAYTARVIGEEQLRMAASGLDSMFAHPLSFIAGLVADDGRFGKHIRNSGRRSTSVSGEAFVDDLGNPVDELKRALNESQFGGWVDQKKLISDEWTMYSPGDDLYEKSWADGIGELHRDPVARQVAQANGNLNQVKDWFWDGTGRNFRKEMVESHPELSTQIGAGEYIDYLAEGVGYRTANDPALLDAIATGRINGERIGAFDGQMRWSNSEALAAHLAEKTGPAAIKGRRADVELDRVGFFDNATNWAFSYLATKPTNYLSRSQAFKQYYWQRIVEMTPWMDEATREAAIGGAISAKLPRDQIKAMRNADINRGTSAPLLRGPDGAPLPVFHGTPEAFEEFDIAAAAAVRAKKYGRNADAMDDPGIYFSPSAEAASTYTGAGSNILERYLDIRKPYHTAHKYGPRSAQEIADLKAQGYDSIITTWGAGERKGQMAEVIVFDPDVIKRGAVDLTNQRTLDEFDQIAKSWALDQTKDLLYDMSNKGQFFDVFRVIFPFGEAWKEVMTRWAKIGMENPKVIRRGQQIITGARGNGFFHKDVNGEETFTYPFSRRLSKLAIGVPIDLGGRVAGLSLMSEVLPGVGPVVQIPAAAIIPDTPDYDFIRDIISPYGETDYSQGFLESFLPGYARNARQFFEQGDPRLFANTVGASMDYLASTGEYDLANPQHTKRLFEDSKDLAKKVYAFRAAAQFVSPTSPLPEMLVQDKNGDLDAARVIIQKFHEWQEDPTIGFDGATERFLQEYGTDLFLLMQSKSFSIAPTLPVSKESAEWERANKGVVDDYGLTWGLFAPKGEGELDYQAFVRQFARGDRETLKPEQRLALAQQRVGRYVYEQAEKKVGDKPSKTEREWLAQIKEAIREEYPGFGAVVPGLPARADLEAVVAELRRSVNDKRVAGTKGAEAARLYMAARDKALAYAKDTGVKTLDAAAAAPAREWLAGIGRAITAKYPEFQEFFDATFSREVDD